jgi:hypothetical protein
MNIAVAGAKEVVIEEIEAAISDRSFKRICHVLAAHNEKLAIFGEAAFDRELDLRKQRLQAWYYPPLDAESTALWDNRPLIFISSSRIASPTATPPQLQSCLTNPSGTQDRARTAKELAPGRFRHSLEVWYGGRY